MIALVYGDLPKCLYRVRPMKVPGSANGLYENGRGFVKNPWTPFSEVQGQYYRHRA